MTRSRVERRRLRADRVDGLFFTFAAVAAVWFALLLLEESARPGWELLLLVVFWAFVAYLLLPRLHRILTRLYVPGYFIGRTRTSDGLLGDPINLALLGSEAQVHAAMTEAGWIRADDLDAGSTRRMITATLTRASYPRAPVSPLHLFDRQQDFAYQQEVGGSTSKRHHVRFWRCPEGWMLPGGYEVDWLAAGTFDRSVGLSLFTFQITHKIEQNTDLERDFLVQTVVGADLRASVSLIRDFSTGYHTRNGGGDEIRTDGDLPVLDVTGVAATGADDVLATDSRHLRPGPTVFGGGVSLLRGVLYLVVGLLGVFTPGSVADVAGYAGSGTPWLVAVGYLLAAGVDLALGVGILGGSNVARLVQMSISTATSLAVFWSISRGTTDVTVATLPSIGLSILMLLALSSHRARDYAHRRRPATVRETTGDGRPGGPGRSDVGPGRPQPSTDGGSSYSGTSSSTSDRTRASRSAMIRRTVSWSWPPGSSTGQST
jgi:hypothetical protein